MQDRGGVKNNYDTLPESFPIEIDRERLRRFLRLHCLIGWMVITGFFGFFAGIGTIGDAIKANELREKEGRQAVILSHATILRHLANGMAMGGSIGLVFYLCMGQWTSAAYARNIRLSVEGAFLRVQSGVFLRQDRKIHFRSIHDYAVVETYFSRLTGVQVLRMNVSGSMQRPWLHIAGIKDCLEVRDMLAEVDARRENA